MVTDILFVRFFRIFYVKGIDVFELELQGFLDKIEDHLDESRWFITETMHWEKKVTDLMSYL